MTSVTEGFLTEYAKEGLRTLLLADRTLSESEYEDWNFRYASASCALIDREGKMAEVAQDVECDLELIGSTAIEDKLQDEVGDTIHSLKAAGIKVWVLTGDKIETAKNIGYSCNLLSNEMFQKVIDGKDPTAVLKQIQAFAVVNQVSFLFS